MIAVLAARLSTGPKAFILNVTLSQTYFTNSGADGIFATPLSRTMLCHPQKTASPCPPVTGKNQPNRMQIE